MGLGRQERRPAAVYRLFGGAEAEDVPAYASLVRYSAPEHVSEAVAQARDEGYDAIKLHQVDVESVHVAREAAGEDILLMLDVNCAWAPDEALDIAMQCIPYNLYWLEEPIWPPEDFRGAGASRAGQRNADRHRRERLHGLPVSAHDGNRLRSLCAAERHQGGRRQRMAQGGQPWQKPATSR